MKRWSAWAELERLGRAIKNAPYLKVAAIAGPGEPLANEATFETMTMVREKFPGLKRCLSTNGLLLPKKLGDLLETGVDSLTITINALDTKTGAEICSLVRYDGETFRGEEGAKLLIEKQVEGLREAVRSEIVVKINTVYIPGVNDEEISKIAELGGREGASIQNVIPLIPLHNFSNLKAPTMEQLKSVRDRRGVHVRQMLHCAHCRADAAGLLGRDIRLD